MSALLIGQGQVFAGVAGDSAIEEFARSGVGQQAASVGVDARHVDLILGLAADAELTPEAAAALVGERFAPYSIERALEIPDFMLSVRALGLGEEIEEAIRSTLMELADENPGMTPTLVRQVLMSENFTVRVSQLIDPQCEDPNLPAALRLSLDCPPIGTSATTPVANPTTTTLSDSGPQFGSVDGYGG